MRLVLRPWGSWGRHVAVLTRARTVTGADEPVSTSSGQRSGDARGRTIYRDRRGESCAGSRGAAERGAVDGDQRRRRLGAAAGPAGGAPPDAGGARGDGRV